MDLDSREVWDAMYAGVVSPAQVSEISYLINRAVSEGQEVVYLPPDLNQALGRLDLYLMPVEAPTQ